MKKFVVKFRVEHTPGINPMQREEIVQCINQNEAREFLARKYGVDKSHIAIIAMRPL